MMALGGFRARAALMGVWGVAVLGFAGASAQAATVGVDCVKPVNLFGTDQDLSSCNLNGVTIGGDNALADSNLTGAKLNDATISGLQGVKRSNLTGASLNRATISGREALRFTTLTGAK